MDQVPFVQLFQARTIKQNNKQGPLHNTNTHFTQIYIKF